MGTLIQRLGYAVSRKMRPNVIVSNRLPQVHVREDDHPYIDNFPRRSKMDIEYR